MTAPLLEISDLSLRYGDAKILNRVNLAVAAGETVGLVGESGSGKSSTVRAALRLLPTSASLEGSVRIGGRDVLGVDERELRSIRADEVALIQQDPRGALNPVRRIGDSLTERLVRVHGERSVDAKRRGLELLEAVGISRPEHRFRQYPHELSGGMLQRVVIAAALTTRPKLLLADEATSALDVTTQAEVLAILRDQQQERGLGVLFITHDLHLAAAYCDRVYVMLRGEVVEELSGANLFAGASDPYTRLLLEAVPTIREETT
ncbi:ABC transporter ATP-binding protein [Agromyces humatus]|uniref:ABC transporter domain-containing protein n=1 Tax=Agromyces humatus TaxID=279573 RepID=A0ABN2KND3_9MICO|nr:ABC transporter ATP-binding protein [Agromyces humatus]